VELLKIGFWNEGQQWRSAKMVEKAAFGRMCSTFFGGAGMGCWICRRIVEIEMKVSYYGA
jgi:hypothetical protein